ncbi:uncharacterized protein N7529_001307 [Penicillium soppii]|uniref:uncharacterized protein n=1 Tax=Penicillium soppii TaxID=69789 RepID=UPI002548DD9B|nr:uncharacterized protein N7529_001307 [Penicillium soppii]KAJ5882635.1 hypothetical protein N7529_001307 [Penicillium soppii]
MDLDELSLSPLERSEKQVIPSLFLQLPSEGALKSVPTAHRTFFWEIRRSNDCGDWIRCCFKDAIHPPEIAFGTRCWGRVAFMIQHTPILNDIEQNFACFGQRNGLNISLRLPMVVSWPM